MLFSLFFIFFTWVNVDSYSAFFNSWHCVGINEHIDFKKPYATNIGELPLVFWKNSKNEIISTMNICKHMGSKMDQGTVTLNGCLKCPYHGIEMNDDDKFGETMEHEGKLFWSYKPTEKSPYCSPFYKNPSFTNSFLEIDMPCSLQDSAYNTLDMHHPQYVHGGVLGFGNAIPPKNIKHWMYKNIPEMVGLSFDYKTTNVALASANSNYTTNFHVFRYPSFTWSKVSFIKENVPKHLIISVNFQPLSNKLTRWFVTISNNYGNSAYKKLIVKAMALTILTQDQIQMKKQASENALKDAVAFQTTLGEENGIFELKKIFDAKYNYPSIEDCVELHKHHKNNKNKT